MFNRTTPVNIGDLYRIDIESYYGGNYEIIKFFVNDEATTTCICNEYSKDCHTELTLNKNSTFLLLKNSRKRVTGYYLFKGHVIKMLNEHMKRIE